MLERPAATIRSVRRRRMAHARHAWAYDGHAHLEVSTDDHGQVIGDTQHLEQALDAIDGVHWAAWNGALCRMVVSFDPDVITGNRLVVALAEAENQLSPPAGASTHVDASVGNVASLTGDLIGAGIATVGKILRLPALPNEIAALPAAFEHVPQLRAWLRRALGPVGADLGQALFTTAVAAATQRPLTSLTDAMLRATLMAEDSAYHDVWAARVRELHRDADSSRAPVLPLPARPRPLPDGPIEQYAQRMSTLTLVAAGILTVLPGGRQRAARVTAVASPRSARTGRDAYAGHLGRALARQGVVVREAAALRRLDRVDTVVIDAAVLLTGRTVVTAVIPVAASEEQTRQQANRLLDVGGEPGDDTTDGWSLTPPHRLDRPVPTEALDRLDVGEPAAGGAAAPEAGNGNGNGPATGDVLALTHRGELMALVRVEAELDPQAEALTAAARRVGRLLIAGRSAVGRNPVTGSSGRALAARCRAEGTVASGSRLAASVRSLQQAGHGVALIATRNDVALAAADCGIGVIRQAARRPPWGAHLICAPGLETAWLVLEATALARAVSAGSARRAMFGSVAAAALGVLDGTPRGGARSLLIDNVAGLVNLAMGYRAARDLGRRPMPVPENRAPWHAMPVDEVLDRLGSSAGGLSDTQAHQRQAEQDGNRPDPDAGRGLWQAAAAELDTPLTGPLAAGAGVSALTGSTVDAVMVLSVIMANALLAGAQEMTAGRALRRLLTAGALRVRVQRDGEQRIGPAEDLVTGDLICLEPGDSVPADCRLITANGLEIDESNLTGESVPVTKSPTGTDATAVAERTSMVYAGTTVAAGTATAVVVATGRSTEAGRSADQVLGEAPQGGVQARLRQIASASVPAALAAAAATLGSGLLRGRLAESVGSSVALAVAAIPEGLPFVATAAQLSASKRLSRHNVLIRDPRAMEALGRVDVICFDKTGTLTQGLIRLQSVCDGSRTEPVDALSHGHRHVLAAALRATPVPDGDQRLPHPTDQAVVDGGQTAGVGLREGADGWELLAELPFEPGRGFHAVLGVCPDGATINVKGAPETVLPRCATWRRGDEVVPLDESRRTEVDAAIDRLARDGLRVLAVAGRAASGRRDLADDRVDQLELRGLLGLADPPRDSAAEAIRRLRLAGIAVVMLTGDHPSTAESIGAQLGLINGSSVVTGADLDAAGPDRLAELVSRTSVFARVSPAHKVAVVRALRQAGRVVAVTGDGANDAPAIQLADVGIALGDHGTSAARQAADMIVVDGRIESIAEGVTEGRAMWVSVREALALLLGGNLGEILFSVGSSLISGQQALNPRQILFVNLMTDLLPAIAVASRPPRGVSTDELAREGPESSLGASLNREVARRAAATALATTGGWLTARFTGTPARASSVALASLVAAQLAQTAVAAKGDPMVLAAAGVSLGTLFGVVQTPVVSQFFGCRPLGPVGWCIVGGSAAAAAGLGLLPLERIARLRRTRLGRLTVDAARHGRGLRPRRMVRPIRRLTPTGADAPVPA
ncbi:HAD-IC family P-type ATPase [Micromonospora sp. NBC_01813]|uniref:HAD-IC family P-type ATPase n=1 Tax=Micromonospora sp. NBC_01813 TaxID=2975988 RepID=UPI002DDC2EFB|nr:HAD-IC family P-type ATPase [Micromonospora sp. NBC_01813]WSA10639.1 HAD-IC family P-type ATPase [Micromonospora sp. NBC_01813]